MKRSELGFTLMRVPLDFLALIAAGTAAYYLRFHPFFTEMRPVIFNLTLEKYFAFLIPIAILWIGVFAISGLYVIRLRSILNELTRIAIACSASMTAVFAISFFSRVLFESRFIALAAWILAILFVSAARLAIRGLQRSLLYWGVGVHRAVIIGKGNSSKVLQELFETKQGLGFHVVKTFAHFSKTTEEEIRKLKRADKIDEIILADPDVSKETSLNILHFSETEHLDFRYCADLFAAAIGRSHMHTYAGIPVIEVKKTPLDGWGAIYKRLFDIVVSGLLILITLPLQIIVALAIAIENPGPILFSRYPNGLKSLRVGQGGKTFHYFKFRSMVKDAHKLRFDPEFIKKHGNERGEGPLFKLKHDPRITKVGRFIRKFSIDEIPEFYLVFLGRMSLVGPRPHLPEEVEQYKPHQRKVMTIKPGITGMAQTSGRQALDFDDEVRLDIYYIEHWSPWLDLKLLFKTPLVVLLKKAY
jgi:exopolysaccharide biosynthesis polyprenyl glycosylphosphotransferase